VVQHVAQITVVADANLAHRKSGIRRVEQP
jgi:hypothetical protein